MCKCGTHTLGLQNIYELHRGEYLREGHLYLRRSQTDLIEAIRYLLAGQVLPENQNSVSIEFDNPPADRK